MPVARKNEHRMGRSKLNLLLKKILERLAGIAGTRYRRGGDSWRRHGSRRSGIFFDRRAKFVKTAVVHLILAGNAFRNRLHAFKSRCRIEVRALLAAVQVESAFRALAFRIESWLQDSAAI